MKKEHLVPYLLHGVTAEFENSALGKTIVRIDSIDFYTVHMELRIRDKTGVWPCDLDQIKPILYPLSEIKNMLRELKWSIHYYNTVISGNDIDLANVSYADTQKLLAKRIDIFGLIGRDEAIDVNTLNKNPNKNR